MFFNKTRADDAMRAHGLDVLIATSPANITYFTDYHCWIDPLFKEYMMVPGGPSRLGQAYAVYPLEGEPALVVNPMFSVNAADLWVRDVYTFGEAPELDNATLPAGDVPDTVQRFIELHRKPYAGATPTDALLRVLEDRGLTDSRVGVETESLDADAESSLTNGLPGASIGDCTNLLRLIRMVKTRDELAGLTRSAQINELAAMESLALARPGGRAADLVQHYRARVAELGAQMDHYIYGLRGVGIAAEPDYRLTDDDVLMMDFGCIYDHQFSDSGTTLAMSEPAGPLLDGHRALRGAIDAAEQVIRPGAKSSDLHGAMRRALNDHGITNGHPHGHSYGLEVREYPIIVADNARRIRDDCVDVPSDIPLEAGMVLNLESCLYYLGAGSVHTEQSFVVTERGSRPLVKQDRAAPFVP